MRKFLSEAAQRIVNYKETGERLVVILPNRRSEVFLKEEIKNQSTKNIWLPEFYPIDEFITKISGFEKSDDISTFFKLFKIHQNVAGEEAKTIDDFLSWAPVMLSDFNDIDNALSDAKEVFTQLSAVKAIQQWNPDGKPLTELQQNYLHFFNSLYEYYTELNAKLKEENVGYQGMINRFVAENITSVIKNTIWDTYLIVGINALSEAEINIFNFINQNYNTTFIWDVDEYYFPVNNADNRQEAGKQIRHVLNRLKLDIPKNIGTHLTKTKKEINIYSVPKNVGQAKFIGQEIDKLFSSSEKLKNSSIQFQNTAIVLANEELLKPLLNSLPAPNNKNRLYNVTLGFPLKNSQAEHFFNGWIDLIISQTQNNGKLNTNKLIYFINSPIIKLFISTNDSTKLIKFLIANNNLNISIEEFINILSPLGDETSQNLRKLFLFNKNDRITTTLTNLSEVLLAILKTNIDIDLLIIEQIKQLIKILAQIIKLASENKNVINYNAIKKIGKQIFSLSKINLVGKPLSGIQIMGMLETRNLDFENIYLLSANEGILPKVSMSDSFIPMDIRRQRNLPLPSDKTDIYAYHFYRLLQRAQNITLIYNSDTDKLGGGEKSRFILQIENELQKINPLIKINHGVISTDFLENKNTGNGNQGIIIDKNPDINKKLDEISKKGFSPSVLSNYIACPLKFYFANIIKISTATTLEASVEANTYGTVIHAVLEEIYKPMRGNKISIDSLKDHLKNTQQLLLNSFKKHYTGGELKSGKNLLIFEVALNYINGFLKWEIDNLKKSPSELQETEIELTTTINNASGKINFKGLIDRVDRKINDDIIHIIDYKTGKVNVKDLEIKSIDELTSDPKYAKAFQVLFYAWLYQKKYTSANIETGIISLRSLSGGFIRLKVSGCEKIHDCFDGFTKLLLNLVTEITDTEIPFSQTEDTNNCKWCNFKSICDR